MSKKVPAVYFWLRLTGGRLTGGQPPCDEDNKAVIYDLNGRRLSAPQKGINIINGKKVVIK